MTQMMAELFSSGRVIDGILALIAVEAVALAAWRCRSGRGPALVPLLCNLASGAALMLAVRAAVTGAAWPVIAACLVGSLCAHAAELGVRLREPFRRNSGSIARGTTTRPVAFPARPLS